MSELTMTLNFTNYSSTTFSRDQNGDLLKTGVSQLTQQCGPTLAALAGTETMAYTQDRVNEIASGDAYIYCCWNNGSWRFGLKLYAQFQMFTLGGPPIFYVMSDNNVDSSTINWVKPPGDPTTPYDFPVTDGLKIVVTPVSGHNTLTVGVLIEGK